LKASKGKEEDTALHLAARKGDNDLVKFLIETGAMVDAQNVSILITMYCTAYAPSSGEKRR
jgi:ankyrin repeat protein